MSVETTATLTEQQLFAAFLSLPIRHTTSFGAVITDYTPEEMLRDGGVYGELDDATDMLANYVIDDEGPEDALDCLVQGLEAYADQLKTVLRDFHHYKDKQRVKSGLSDIEPTEPEALKAWEAAWEEYENAPRFHAPAHEGVVA